MCCNYFIIKVFKLGKKGIILVGRHNSIVRNTEKKVKFWEYSSEVNEHSNLSQWSCLKFNISTSNGNSL